MKTSQIKTTPLDHYFPCCDSPSLKYYTEAIALVFTQYRKYIYMNKKYRYINKRLMYFLSPGRPHFKFQSSNFIFNVNSELKKFTKNIEVTLNLTLHIYYFILSKLKDLKQLAQPRHAIVR